MSNLNGIPSADYFETTLANTWNGTTGTVYVDAVPSASIPVGEYSYIVVNPGESNMQVAKIDGWDSDSKTFNVTDVVVDSGAGTQYTAKTHPLGAIVRFSNNYAFWKDIQTAVNTKADDSDISAVGKSNDYNDLDNIPTFATVATSGDYNDLDNLPTPVTIDGGDDILQLSGSNVLSATVTASYDSGTKKITLYGANSAVLSEIDCTAFIKDGMIENVQIVTDPVGYAPGKYLEFDFNTDSGISDIYIALSDLAVYTAGEGISISSNAVSVVAATASTLGGIKVGSGLTISSGTLSANSQTDENYTTAEKTKLSGIESGAEVNDIEKVQVNGTDLPISSKTVNVKLKTINGEAISGEGDINIIGGYYTEGTGICINSDNEISISTAYQTVISCKANCSDIPTDNCQLGNGCGYITSTDISGFVQESCVACINGCCLTQGGNICICGGGGGGGDMFACTYDPCNCSTDAFNYSNMYNTPTIPTDNCQLGNGCGYITGISCGDITTALGYTPANSANLGTASSCNTGTSSGNVPVLDSNGKLNTSTLPGVALTDTFTVTNKADLTSLSSADQGDIGIVTSESKTYVLSQAPYSTVSNWKELLSPTDAVTSVNSKTGAVTLNADDISDSTTTNKFVTASDKTTWSGKQDALTLPSTPTSGHLVTWGGSNKTLVDGGTVPTGVPAVGTNGQVLTVVSGVAAWANASGGSTTISVTLTAAGWSGGTQTVTATGVTSSNTVIISPAPANIQAYVNSGVYASAQGTNSLTFTASQSTPNADLTVNVVILS